jgi:thiol-disulfide isomerase/thioredoxin
MSFDLSEMANQEMKKPGEPEIHTELVVTYDHWRLNPDLAPETFKLTIPPGATRLDSKAEPAAKKPVEEETLIGKPAPNSKLALLDGGQIDLASHKGKQIIILQFWAGWSIPSMRALPEIVKIAEAYKNKSVILYAINEGQSPEAARTLISKLNPAPVVALETQSSISELYKASPPPFYVVIDKRGIIRYYQSDYRFPEDLKQKLDALLAEEKSAAISRK